MQQKIKNAMTIDVEDYFQVGAFENLIDRNDWDKYESRVERNTDAVLQIFDDAGMKGTFFVLSYIAQKTPQLMRRIIDQGHEIASHGTDHRRVTSLNKEEFLADLISSKNIIEDISGGKVMGYRAPSFSFTKDNQWVYESLAEAGYKYSSSVYPVKHDHYGIPDAPRFNYDAGCGIRELPLCTLNVRGKNIPISGGGFFRLYPYWLTKSVINRFHSRENNPYIFYLHPWEVDPGQPKISGANFKQKFRHYLNLDKTHSRLERLSNAFTWSTMADVFEIN